MIFKIEDCFFISTASRFIAMTGFICYFSSMLFLHTYLRKYIILLALLVCTLLSHAQKNDYIWLMGYRGSDGFAGYDSSWGTSFGTTVFNFNNNPVEITFDSLMMRFSSTNVTYSDSNGNLLFYTNGISVANALDEKLSNGDSLNFGWLTNDFATDIQNFGYNYSQAILALQNINNEKEYFLIHSFSDSFPGSNESRIYAPKIYKTLIDMDVNSGHGSVVYKNVPIINGRLGNELSATKHANGRDWWLVVQKRNTNCFYKILYDPLGFHVQNDTTEGVGDTVSIDDIGSSCFSPDGSMYANFNTSGGLRLFDFDRCTGKLSNGLYIYMNIFSHGWLGNGLAFSPNSRFLYVCATNFVLQYDTWATDIATSVDTVAIYDGHFAANGSILRTNFNTPQLAPDGKIYISCGNSVNEYHVINNPDAKGDSCNLIQHGVLLPSFCISLPNYPNYRLGALPDNACDTLTAINDIAEKEKILKVFPNPATDAVTIDYGYTNWEKGDVDLEINNAAGQLVYTQHLPMYSGFQRLDVMQYAKGVYSVTIKRGNNVVAVSQFVKQ